MDTLEVIDLGVMPYAAAYEVQVRTLERVLAARESGAAREAGGAGRAVPGVLLMVEHPPVITISNRPTATANLLVSEELLREQGVEVQRTDRGGDITYHGPGQLVVYPILDMNVLGLRLHEHMRMMEDVVIRVCARFGVTAGRDVCATGVWVGGGGEAGTETGAESCGNRGGEKICAMGVRVRKWISMHGLALNVTTDLEHFGLIVPCGLVGRGVTSLGKLLGERCPGMDEVKGAMVREFEVEVRRRMLRV